MERRIEKDELIGEKAVENVDTKRIREKTVEKSLESPDLIKRFGDFDLKK